MTMQEEFDQLQAKKNALASDQREYQSKNDEAKLVKASAAHWSMRNKAQSDIVHFSMQLTRINRALAEINPRYKELKNAIQAAKNMAENAKQTDEKPVECSNIAMQALSDLRTKWLVVSEDKTRISSYRMVATEVERDIQKVINLFNLGASK